MPKNLLIFCLFFCLLVPAVRAERDIRPPRLIIASVSGAVLTLTYDELLDTTSAPALGSFRIVRTEPTFKILRSTGVSISGSTVVIILAEPVLATQAVTIEYCCFSGPGTRIQDLSGNYARAFGSGQKGLAVWNNTLSGTPVTSSRGGISSEGTDDYIDDMVEACRAFINAAEERDR